LIERRSSSAYDIDGIVIVKDSDELNILEEEGNPDYAIAYKMCLVDQLAETVVIGVEWNPSKHGQLKPRIRYEPFVIAGNTYQWTSGFNAKFISDNKIGPGSKLQIVRSGDINPYIKEVLSESTSGLPDFPTDYEWHWNETKVDIILDDINSCSQVEIKRLANFFKEMGIKGIAEGTTTKFVDNGWDLAAVLSATQEDFKQLDHVADKMSANLYKAIQSSIKNVPLLRIMVASGAFGMGLGNAKIGSILETYPNILDKYENTPRDKLIAEICQLDGFALKTATNFYEGLVKFKKFMAIHGNNITISTQPIKKREVDSEGVMAGQLVSMTGFRNVALEDWILRRGGRTSNSPSARMTILIVKDLTNGSGTAKFKKAQSLGAKIYDLDSFMSKYRVNY
jgi:NAD-dependent DNA ligase